MDLSSASESTGLSPAVPSGVRDVCPCQQLWWNRQSHGGGKSGESLAWGYLLIFSPGQVTTVPGLHVWERSVGKCYAHSQCDRRQQHLELLLARLTSSQEITLLFTAASCLRTQSCHHRPTFLALVLACYEPQSCHRFLSCFLVWLFSLLFAHTDGAQWIPNSILYLINMQLA